MCVVDTLAAEVKPLDASLVVKGLELERVIEERAMRGGELVHGRYHHLGGDFQGAGEAEDRGEWLQRQERVSCSNSERNEGCGRGGSDHSDSFGEIERFRAEMPP